MADVEWPSSDLPVDPLYGWSEVPGNSVIRTQTDAGPAKLRRRFSTSPSQFSMQFALTTAQATRLMQFYTNSTDGSPAGTAGGSMTFGTLPHPRTGAGTPVWRFTAPPVITQDAFGHFKGSIRVELISV